MLFTVVGYLLIDLETEGKKRKAPTLPTQPVCLICNLHVSARLFSRLDPSPTVSLPCSARSYEEDSSPAADPGLRRVTVSDRCGLFDQIRCFILPLASVRDTS